MLPEEKKMSPQIENVKKELATCHIRVSLKSLTNESIFELVEKDLTAGAAEPNLRDSDYATSDFSTFLNVLKSSLGSGVLAMPSAFKNAGLLVGLVGTLVMGLICAHCTYILVKTSQTLCLRLNKSHLNYPETAEAVFQHAMNGRFKKYANVARLITNVCILLPHYGAGIIYVLLASQTAKQVIESYTGEDHSIRWYILLIAIPLLPVGIIRQMRVMVPFSALANLFLLVGVSLTLYYTLQDLPPLSSRPLYADINKLPLFMSTVLFGMEGIGVILPIENAMKNPRQFLGRAGILNRAMAIVVCLSLTIGCLGYVKYGDAVEGSITLNLPDTTLAQLVKVLVTAAILCTYGLQVMAAAQIAWVALKPVVASGGGNATTEDVAYYAMRVLMVVGHVVSAALLPRLAPVISLIGAVGLPLLGLTLPVGLETLLMWEDGVSVWLVVKNALLILLAAVTLVSGTWVSCRELADSYR